MIIMIGTYEKKVWKSLWRGGPRRKPEMKRESKLDSQKRLRDPSQNEHGGPRRNTGVSPPVRGLQPRDVPLGTGTRGRDAGNAEGLYVACVAVFTERFHVSLFNCGYVAVLTERIHTALPWGLYVAYVTVLTERINTVP